MPAVTRCSTCCGLGTAGRELALLQDVRDIIRRVDPNQPISDVMPLSEVLDRQTAPRRAQVNVLAALAVVALVLAGLGIPGLLVALLAGNAMRALLFGVPPIDPVTILLTLALSIGVSLTGAWVPALRAIRVDPMHAMREG